MANEYNDDELLAELEDMEAEACEAEMGSLDIGMMS